MPPAPSLARCLLAARPPLALGALLPPLLPPLRPPRGSAGGSARVAPAGPAPSQPPARGDLCGGGPLLPRGWPGLPEPRHRGPMPASDRADPRGTGGAERVTARGRRSVATRLQRGLVTPRPPPLGRPRPRQPASPPRLPAPFSAPAPRGCAALPLPSCLSPLLFLSPSPPASAAGGRDWDFLRSQGWGQGPLAAVGPGLWEGRGLWLCPSAWGRGLLRERPRVWGDI